MTNTFKYKIITDLRLLILYYSGKITSNSIIEFVKIFAEDKDYNPNFNVISDLRNTKISASETDIKEFVEFLINNHKTQGKRNSALLTNTPDQVVVSTLYLLNKSNLQTKINIFSTLQEATKWLNYSQDEFKIIDEILIRLINNKT